MIFICIPELTITLIVRSYCHHEVLTLGQFVRLFWIHNLGKNFKFKNHPWIVYSVSYTCLPWLRQNFNKSSKNQGFFILCFNFTISSHTIRTHQCLIILRTCYLYLRIMILVTAVQIWTLDYESE